MTQSFRKFSFCFVLKKNTFFLFVVSGAGEGEKATISVVTMRHVHIVDVIHKQLC